MGIPQASTPAYDSVVRFRWDGELEHEDAVYPNRMGMMFLTCFERFYKT